MNDGSEIRIDQYLEKWYSRKDALIRGDKTTSYMEFPEVAGRIASAFPKALIVFVLRDPIDRAISNYCFTKRHKLEELSIDDALSDEAMQDRPYDTGRLAASPFNYLRRGRYIDYMRPYLERFDARQVRISLFESLVGNLGAVQAMYDFLGVEPGFVPTAIDDKVNATADEMQAQISARTEAFLSEYFRLSNQALRSSLHLDINQWRSMNVKARS